jgi:hypothetical protein
MFYSFPSGGRLGRGLKSEKIKHFSFSSNKTTKVRKKPAEEIRRLFIIPENI